MGTSVRDRKNRITKELGLALTPIAAAYLFILFYEAGFASYFGIPIDFIEIRITDIFLTNRLTLIAAVIAFLWIGLYYDMLPSASSPVFKGLITAILVLSLWLGFTFGKYDARTKENFLVTNERPEYVVLVIYGENIIMAPLDRAKNAFSKRFKVAKVGRDGDKVYKMERVGPLRAQ